MNTWLVDSGPLLAYLVSEEEFHSWTLEQMKKAPVKIFTCEAVITEVLFLLVREGYPPETLFALIDSGLLRCEFDFHREYRSVRALMRKYRDLPMSYADACLVRLAELNPDACVWTLDRHFQRYRRFSRETIPLIIP